MTKFVPDLKPCLLVVYLKKLEAWTVPFGPNQVWSIFGFCLNFKFKQAHSSASSLFSFWRTPLQRPASTPPGAAAAARCHCRPDASLPPLECAAPQKGSCTRHAIDVARRVRPLCCRRLLPHCCGRLDVQQQHTCMRALTQALGRPLNLSPNTPLPLVRSNTVLNGVFLARHCCRWKLTADRTLHYFNHPADEPNGSGHLPPCSRETPSSLKLHKTAAFQLFPMLP
jgi:hypothetical protein